MDQINLEFKQQTNALEFDPNQIIKRKKNDVLAGGGKKINLKLKKKQHNIDTKLR